MLTELFSAVKVIAELIPDFPEEKKELLEKETENLIELQEEFNNAMVEFKIGSNTDELFGISSALNLQAEKLKNFYVIYSSELKAKSEN